MKLGYHGRIARLPSLPGYVDPLLKGIGLLLFLWLLSQIDRAQLAGELSRVDLPLFALAFAVYMASYAVKVVRWHLLLRAAGLHARPGYAWETYNVGTFLGMITPGKVGEFGRVGYLRTHGMSGSTALAVVLVDRVFDVLAIALLAIVSMGVLFGVWWFAAGCLAAIAAAPFSIWAVRRARRSKSERPWVLFLAALLRRPPLLAGLLAVTVLSWAVYAAWPLALAASVGLHPPAVPLVCAVILAGIVALLPVAPSGLGTRDASLVFLLGPLGVGPAQAVALAFLLFVQIVASTAFGAWHWARGVSGPHRKR